MSLTREELIEAIRQMEDGVRADEGEPLKGDTAEMAEKRQRDLQMLEAAIATEGRNLAAAADRLDRELKEARSERDAARLELRALEWLTFESPRQSFSFGFEERATGRVVWVSRPGTWPTEEFSTYASAARALGWEG